MIGEHKKRGYKSIKTPICDFLQDYAKSNSVRLHMPGHKGKGDKINAFDITEIAGADSLYFADGIIAESEKIAGEIFGADTFYSCEGSSLCIRAMVRLVSAYAYARGEKPMIWAARNAHSSFVSAVALCGCDVKWLAPQTRGGYLSCIISAEDIDKALLLAPTLPTALYLTSPDYLGNISDIKSIADICRKHGVLFIVDNAHGAYLKFLSPSMHPIDLGADMCADSAHKTLPALTGTAYLHISKSLPAFFKENAKSALALFGSTSPSYLLLRSLDRLNATLLSGYIGKIRKIAEKTARAKAEIISLGFCLSAGEPLKISIAAKSYGYRGEELAEILLKNKIVADFYDDDYVVLMPSAETSARDFKRLIKTLKAIPKKPEIENVYPDFSVPKAALSVADAYKKPTITVGVDETIGLIAGENEIRCPPAVPIIIAGEIIDEKAISALKYYKTTEIKVLKQ